MGGAKFNLVTSQGRPPQHRLLDDFWPVSGLVSELFKSQGSANRLPTSEDAVAKMVCVNSLTVAGAAPELSLSVSNNAPASRFIPGTKVRGTPKVVRPEI